MEPIIIETGSQLDTEMDIANLVDQAIICDREIKEKKKNLDSLKAILQGLALQDMENKNIKHVQLFGSLGNFEAAYKEKLEIDNYRMLINALGDIVRDKVKRKVEVKFETDTRFKAALIALIKGDFKEHDMEAILVGMGLGEKAIKIAKKKLKGDYKADKKTLEDLLITGNREEELDAIREVKNLELVQRFFNLSVIDREMMKRALFLEETLSVTMTYNDAEGAS